MEHNALRQIALRGRRVPPTRGLKVKVAERDHLNEDKVKIEIKNTNKNQSVGCCRHLSFRM
jgi:hypothetical protein